MLTEFISEEDASYRRRLWQAASWQVPRERSSKGSWILSLGRCLFDQHFQVSKENMSIENHQLSMNIALTLILIII